MNDPRDSASAGGPVKQYRIRKSDIPGPDQDPQYYYVQVGGNGEVLNTSELYTRAADAERGVADANPDGGFMFIREYEDEVEPDEA